MSDKLKITSAFIHATEGGHVGIKVARNTFASGGFVFDIGPLTVFLDQPALDHLAAILAPFATPAPDGIDEALAQAVLDARP